MTGSIKTSHYKEVKDTVTSSQSQLTSFSSSGGSTTIAVVSFPRDTDIDSYCDEWMPELGMPEKHLKRFWKYKRDFTTNSAVDNPTKRAYNEARLEHYYRRHIQTSQEAQKAIDSIVSRLKSGEDVTLVCFEKPSEPCHRYLLADLIEARLSSRFEYSQTKGSTIEV